MKNNLPKIGFLPCFSNYKFNYFPVEDLYQNVTAVNKVKQLMSAFIDSESTFALKKNIGKDVEPIRPESKETKKLINLFAEPFDIFRIDYGNTPFRVVFGLLKDNNKRFAYILAFDMKHKTLPQKKHQR